MGLINCRILYLILEGTAKDYKEILAKSKDLSKYELEWYINKIIPHIKKMVEQKKEKLM